MEQELIIYHGSDHVIETPTYGIGKDYNDYGLGFYCTEYLELAQEWACSESHGGFANKYAFDLTGLLVLDLNSKNFCILHWISILLQNRRFTVESDMANSARKYILENFPVDTGACDVIMGYRADDSYFTYAKDFLQNTISVRRLSQVMKLGNLGNQIVLKSAKAFSQIRYIESIPAPQEVHFPLRKKRDELARYSYLNDKTGGSLGSDDILVIDLIRGEVKADDPRLQ